MRPKHDPSGIDSKEPPARITVPLRGVDKDELEKLWRREMAKLRDKEKIGFGAWLGERLVETLEFREPAQAPAVVPVSESSAPIVDGATMARALTDELLPELSDVLRRAAFKAMDRVGEQTARTMAEAMTRATEKAIGIAAHEASREAGRVAAVTLAPEIRRLAALVEGLTAPVEIGTTKGTRH